MSGHCDVAVASAWVELPLRGLVGVVRADAAGADRSAQVMPQGRVSGGDLVDGLTHPPGDRLPGPLGRVLPAARPATETDGGAQLADQEVALGPALAGPFGVVGGSASLISSSSSRSRARYCARAAASSTSPVSALAVEILPRRRRRCIPARRRRSAATRSTAATPRPCAASSLAMSRTPLAVANPRHHAGIRQRPVLPLAREPVGLAADGQGTRRGRLRIHHGPRLLRRSRRVTAPVPAPSWRRRHPAASRRGPRRSSAGASRLRPVSRGTRCA